MPKAAILNTLTRLLLVVVFVLWLTVQSKLWLTVLVAGLVTIVLLYLFNVKGKQGFQEDFRRIHTHRRDESVEEPVVSKSRTGLVGTETKKVPRTSTVRLDGVEKTLIFRKCNA